MSPLLIYSSVSVTPSVSLGASPPSANPPPYALLQKTTTMMERIWKENWRNICWNPIRIWIFILIRNTIPIKFSRFPSSTPPPPFPVAQPQQQPSSTILAWSLPWPPPLSHRSNYPPGPYYLPYCWHHCLHHCSTLN